MIIKQKNDLSQASILLIDYLKSISIEPAQEQEEGGENEEKRLKQFLAEVAGNRKSNELIYAYNAGVLPQINRRWGIEASETADCYKRNFDSTITRGEGGWAEFAISYDNKVFLSTTSADSEENSFDFNHETMGCGTFLKAAGKLKLENGELIISPYSQYLVLGHYYLPIILFVFREKGYPISPANTFIVDEEGSFLPCMKVFTPANSSVDAVSEYLDVMHFPSAKAIAENKKLSITASLSELFLSIDDEILSEKRKHVIKILNAQRAVLKADIIGFLSLFVETNLRDVAKMFSKQEQDVTENNLHAVGEGSEKQEQSEDRLDAIPQETIYQRYEKINTHIQTFQSHRVNISFVMSEVSSWCYYLAAQRFQAGSEMEMMISEKKDTVTVLAVLQEIEANLTKIKEIPSILPQRLMVEPDGTVSSFIKFFSGKNPIEAFIESLHDYTKGGFFWRFLSGAWRRNHVKSVERFLEKYKSHQFADNLSIQDIYQELFGVEGPLEEHPGKKGTLFARLLFFAKLANEVQNESRDQALVVTSSNKTSEKLEGEGESQETVISETSPLITATTATIDPSSPSALKRTVELEMPSVRSSSKVRFHTPSPDKDKVFGNSEGAASSNDKQDSSTISSMFSSSSLFECS